MRHLKLPNAFSLLQSKRKWVLAYVFNSKTLIFKKSVYKDLLHKTICLYRKISLKNVISNLQKRQLRILFSAVKDYRLKYLLLCNPLLSFFGKVAIFFQKQNCNKKYLLLKMPLFVHFYWTRPLRNLRTKIQFMLVVVTYFFLAYPHQKRNFFWPESTSKATSPHNKFSTFIIQGSEEMHFCTL